MNSIKTSFKQKFFTGLAVTVPIVITNNLYLGDIVLFKEDEVIDTSLPIEEGIRVVLSGGIALPDSLQGTGP